MASLLNIGVSGLRAQQAGLAVTGQNITNASTPGYSRQRVDVAPAQAGVRGGDFSGAGVTVEAIRRITDEFANNQVRSDTALFAQMDALVGQIQQLENLLFDDGSGLSGSLQAFFQSLQDAANAPESLPERQLVLAEGKALAARFQGLHGQLEAQANSLRDNLAASVRQVNELAQGVANLNERIQGLQSESRSGALNGLLDQRDELIRKLSEQITIKTEAQNNGAVNLYVGKGQPLVVGTTVNTLAVTPSGGIALSTGVNAASQDITSAISGGALGAALSFRDQALGSAFNSLGRLAYALTEAVNFVHAGGIGLDGEFGADFFVDLNSSDNRIRRAVAQHLSVPGQSGAIEVRLGDAQHVQLSDYEITFSETAEGSILVRRLSDREVVFQGALTGETPQTLRFDELEVTLSSGVFNPGDRYRIQPLRDLAAQFEIAVADPRQLALALPVRAEPALGNGGSGVISVGELFDKSHPIFSETGELTPPLLVRFNSATSYDILDNSDPANPVDLVPPRRNLQFDPGQPNALLPENVGGRLTLTDGSQVAGLSGLGSISVGLDDPLNGYGPEVLNLRQTDPITGQELSERQIAIGANASAETIAAQLNSVPGLKANGTTEVVLSELANNGIGTSFEVYVNGERFADPPSLAALADAIAANDSLRAQGIQAVSDGEQLRLRSVTGKDLDLHIAGDPTDSVRVSNGRGESTRLNGAGPGDGAVILGTQSLTSGYDFAVGGPYTLEVAASPGGATASLNLTGTYVSAPELVDALQTQLDSAFGQQAVRISLDSGNRLVLTSAATGPQAEVSIDLSGPAQLALGLATTTATGAGHYRSLSIGGTLAVELPANFELSGSGGLFSSKPAHYRNDLGFELEMNGRPEAGDRFSVEFNAGGTGDNRNGLRLAGLAEAKTVGDPPQSFSETYAALIQDIGVRSAQATTDRNAARSLLDQSIARRESISGVNLDEEAANLIRYEQAYNASAQVISVARDVFSVLINAVS